MIRFPGLVPWIAPSAAHLPELRIQICEQATNPLFTNTFLMRIKLRGCPLLPIPGTPAGEVTDLDVVCSQVLATCELRRVSQAQLYWADEDMTSLALAAAAVPTREPVRARRMPAETGLMMFAQPIGDVDMTLSTAVTGPWSTAVPGLDDELRMVSMIVAVSWSRWSPADLDIVNMPIRWRMNAHNGDTTPLPYNLQGIWLTFWTTVRMGWDGLPADKPIKVDRRTGKTSTAADMAAREALSTAADLMPHSEMLLRFDQPLPDPGPDARDQWAHVVYTAWQLMAQSGANQLTETETVSRARPGLRRDQRAHIRGPGSVQLVRVHTRHRPPAQASVEDAAASHGRRAPQWTRRWPVRPYRRNTCLNPYAHADGGCEHEERVVPAHIRGPADKPLVVTKRVHVWDTPPPSES